MSRRPIRRAAGALLLALALAAAGCGDDESDSADRPTTTAPETDTATAETDTAAETDTGAETATDESGGEEPSREEQVEGGPGDEEPIRSEAVFTARDGRIAPRVVRVPPFIAVRVVLRSGDGIRYGLRIRGRTLSVGPGQRSDAVTLGGLQPNQSYVGAPIGAQTVVKVEASAEPGP
jgi:hypothetical protein